MSPAKCDVTRRIGPRARLARLALVLQAAGLAACTGEGFGPAPPFSDCSLPLANFTDAGTERSNIPALTNPDVATRLIAPQVGYVNRGDLVIGLQFNQQPLAIPLKLLWYHEVLNLQADHDPDDPTAARERLTITYSALTGSVRVFDPAATDTPDFAVSNYVLDNNLVMDDGSGTLYPQLTRSATCGPQDGTRLRRVPYELLVYGAWLQIFQDTWIATRVTGHDFLYTLYPYGNYRDPDNASLFYPTAAPIDLRRRPKERVVGVPSGTGGVRVRHLGPEGSGRAGPGGAEHHRLGRECPGRRSTRGRVLELPRAERPDLPRPSQRAVPHLRGRRRSPAGTWKRGACGTSAARPWRDRSREKGLSLTPRRTMPSGSRGPRSSRTPRCGCPRSRSHRLGRLRAGG